MMMSASCMSSSFCTGCQGRVGDVASLSTATVIFSILASILFNDVRRGIIIAATDHFCLSSFLARSNWKETIHALIINMTSFQTGILYGTIGVVGRLAFLMLLLTVVGHLTMKKFRLGKSALVRARILLRDFIVLQHFYITLGVPNRNFTRLVLYLRAH